MKKSITVFVVILIVTLAISSCSSSSRISVDPWPGLHTLKETNRQGYKNQKKRTKIIKKAKAKRKG